MNLRCIEQLFGCVDPHSHLHRRALTRTLTLSLPMRARPPKMDSFPTGQVVGHQLGPERNMCNQTVSACFLEVTRGYIQPINCFKIYLAIIKQACRLVVTLFHQLWHSQLATPMISTTTIVEWQ
jgi:hypothetical protein